MLIPLQVDQLIKNYGGVQAVKGVSFALKPGEIFGLLGPNGAGKTSIISCIVTLEDPTNGVIQVFGHNVQEEPRQAKYKIGLVPQELINHGFFDVEEILEFHSGYFGFLRNRERINYLMHKLGLWEHRKKKIRQLSGGMKRRLLVAKALVHRPQLLLLDEPTAGVDIELRSSLWEFVRELRQEGVTILLTTHYLEEAEELCDRVGILNFGNLVKVGETRHLIEQLTLRQICFRLPSKQILHHPMLIKQEGELKVFNIPYTMNLSQLFDELKLTLNMVQDLAIREGRLEDAFRNVLGGHGA